eukprot:TRINITY_DN5515_c0_g1_i1.p1 TRINITY_DN5515_c0_g1~~TRINITY_DN5515_c0_g1_i1.p1  ORF type:complete len:146 (-),score=22.78 TRINITY_DN5515_c0_g1_i1:2-439(-)
MCAVPAGGCGHGVGAGHQLPRPAALYRAGVDWQQCHLLSPPRSKRRCDGAGHRGESTAAAAPPQTRSHLSCGRTDARFVWRGTVEGGLGGMEEKCGDFGMIIMRSGDTFRQVLRFHATATDATAVPAATLPPPPLAAETAKAHRG